MKKSKFKAAARKTLAVLSAAALIASYGTFGLVMTADAAQTDKPSSGGTTGVAANVMYVYDKYDNNLNATVDSNTNVTEGDVEAIASSAIVYVDNRSIVTDGDKKADFTKATFTVEITNSDFTDGDELILDDAILEPYIDRSAYPSDTVFFSYSRLSYKVSDDKKSVRMECMISGCSYTKY